MHRTSIVQNHYFSQTFIQWKTNFFLVLSVFIEYHQYSIVLIVRICIVERNITSCSFTTLEFNKFSTVPQVPLTVFELHFLLAGFACFTFVTVFTYSFHIGLFTVAYPKAIFRDSPFCTVGSISTVFTIGDVESLTVRHGDSQTISRRSNTGNPLTFVNLAF